MTRPEVPHHTSIRPEDPGAAARGGTAAATDGWASRLVVVVGAMIVLETVTGLWIWLGPFSLGAQIQLIVHTVVGFLFIGPYLYYQVKHWLVWWRQTVTPAMVLGYFLMIAVLTSMVTGILLTWQAAMGPRIAPLVDLIHLVSGIGTVVLLFVHLGLAWWRRRHSAAAGNPLAVAQRRFCLRSLVAIFGPLAPMVVVIALVRTEPQVFDVPDGYSLPVYTQQFEEYRGNPFAPSYARTEEQNLVASSLLAGSSSCGSSGCHEEILAEWEPSAHRFAAMNPPFQKVQRDFAEDRGAAETRYCAGCHDPISLFAGAKDIHNLSLSSPGMQEGISCVVCHSISKVDQRGNADYVLTPPQKYLWEGTDGWRKKVSDFLIRAYPRQHLADYDRNVLRTPEYCGACHKQFIPEALNRFGFSEGQNQYDEWRNSHWNADDPHKNLSCRDCHMRLVADSSDPGAGEAGDIRRRPDDRAHRHHGTIGANVFMPALLKLPHADRHIALTEEWLRGDTVLPEIADVYPKGPVAALRITGPKSVRPGEEVAIKVTITNRKAGHNYTTGPLDFLRSWVHLVVRDADGKTVGEWGGIDPETRRIMDETGSLHRVGNPRDKGTLVLESIPIDDKGEELREHELWRKSGGKGKRVIFPNYSDAQTYRIKVPDGCRGPLEIKADLNYRRYRQEFLDLSLPGLEENTGVYQPTVTQSTAALRIPVAAEGTDGGR